MWHSFLTVLVIKQTEKFTIEYGDILRGNEYIKGIHKGNKYPDGKLVLLLLSVHMPWNALRSFGIDSEGINKAFKYKCPWTDNDYWYFVPRFIVTQKHDYSEGITEPFLGMMADNDWVRKMMLLEKCEPSTEPLIRAFRGHGYNYEVLPTDGSGK